MLELATETVNRTNRAEVFRNRSLPGFRFENGYTFCATDLGNSGVKIELVHENHVAGAIILPPKAVGECGRWMLETLGQDRHGFPHGLSDILRRLSKHKPSESVLQRGDKKKLKDAIRVLRSKKA